MCLMQCAQCLFLSCLGKKWRPIGKFNKKNAPNEPDYDNMDCWAAYPGKPSNAELVPDNGTTVLETERKCDMFFVHPTGCFHGPNWNADVYDDPQADEMTDEYQMATQASVFNETCRIYAPRYRQMCYMGYMTQAKSAAQAMELAYSDVVKAFEHFLQKVGNEKPFLIGSHSQGGHHIIRLLEEKIHPDNDLCKRMIACYLIGSTIPRDKFQRSIPKMYECTSPIDHTSVVIGFDVQSDKCKKETPLPEAYGIWYKTGIEKDTYRKGAKTIQTHPIKWTKSEFNGRISGTDGWLGSVNFKVEGGGANVINQQLSGSKPTVVGFKTIGLYREDPLPKEKFWAESKNDRITIPHLSPSKMGFYGNLMKNGEYHLSDYQLFYFNIKENVKLRVNTYLKEGPNEIMEVHPNNVVSNMV